MTYKDVMYFFQNKRDAAYPLTDKLIESGFRQKNNGYIDIAKKSGLENPSQWWHLMQYCLVKVEMRIENNSYRYTPCGELVFWMAEVSGAVNKQMLEELANKIIRSGDIDNRKKWNNEIKNLCWEEIKRAVMEKLE